MRRFFIHGHTISRKKDTSDIYSHCPITDFCATFLYNRRCLTSEKTKSGDKNKVAATPTEQGNICSERRLCLF